MKQLHREIDYFVAHIQELGRSVNTAESYRRDLEKFASYLIQEQVLTWDIVRHDDVVLFLQRLQKEQYAIASTTRLLSSLRKFFSFLVEQKIILTNPMAQIKLPKKEKRLPKALTAEEVIRLIRVPDTTTIIGVRDRAMLELMYAAGLRVSELITLTISDIRVQFGFIRVTGKGNKQRIIPIGESAIYWLDIYMQYARVQLVNEKQENDSLFLNHRGGGFTRQGIWKNLKELVKKAGITKEVSPHTLRHSFATQLLEGGTEIRFVQELLGHENVITTQIYTHVANKSLTEVYDKTHPRNQMDIKYIGGEDDEI